MEFGSTQSLIQKLGLRELVGQGPHFLSEVRKIPIAAKCSVSILISGETGTGKEVFARAIHYLSGRASKPFTPVNCGAIPAELLENELFGHASGAYTGAASCRDGLIADSEGGTLFLDELDCMPLQAQVKLLRFLQEKEFRPLGDSKVRRADVRVIAASNVDLDEALKQNRLRRDLYYRLNVLQFTLPPLRERAGDIPLLCEHFLRKYCLEFAKEITSFSEDVLQLLLRYEWPGNVRELEHMIERAVLMCESGSIQPADFALPQAQVKAASFREAKAQIVAQFERRYLQGLMAVHDGNISQAAKAARKNRRAFFQLLRKHGLTRTNTRAG